MSTDSSEHVGICPGPTILRRFSGAIFLILLAAALAMIEFRAARSATMAEFDRTLAAHEYASISTTEFVPAIERPARKRIRVSAPLENAWMNITATVVRADGTVVDSCRFYIDAFQKPQRGIHWTWGLPMASALVHVPDGGYRLRLEVAAKPESSPAPPLRVQVLPAVAGSQARLIACAVAAVFGVGLLLRGLTGIRAGAHPQTGPSPGHRESGGHEPIEDAFPSGRLHFIDGLRGIAALGVLMCHLFVPEFLPSVRVIEENFGNRFPEIMRTGMLGVEVFFVLSGFVIAYSIRHYRVTPAYILRFIARRFLRLDPPYYVAVFLALVVMAYALADSLHAVLPYFQSGTGLLINALYLQDILYYRSPIGTVAWTLCLEVQFYLALVILTGISQAIGRRFARIGSRASATRAAWWLLTGTLGVASVVIWHTNHASFTFIATWFRFLLGVLVFRSLAARASPWPIAGLLGALMIMSILFLDARGATASATAGLILAAGRFGALGRWLNGRACQFLGRISYSLYLHHIVLAIPFLAFAWSHLPHTLTVALLMVPFGIVVAIAFAWVMHALIERPSVALSHRVRYTPARPKA